MEEGSQSLPLPVLPSIHPEPITNFDQQRWHSQSTNTGDITRRRRRRRSGGDVTPRLAFAALRILLEHICEDEHHAKRIYRCLQKSLDKYFEGESTPKYDLMLFTTRELDRVISDIARQENIDIRLYRCRSKPSLIIRNQVDQPKRMNAHNFLQNYFVLGVLGRGGFGKVYHVRNKLDLREYALKEIPLRAGSKRAEMNENEKICREVVNLAQLDGPNIVRYFYAWLEYNPVLDFSRTPQRFASIEYSDESHSPLSSGSPLPCDLQPSLTIEEMSPRSGRGKSFDFNENGLPKSRELNSKDFERPDGEQWGSDWSSDEGEENLTACTSMSENRLAVPAGPNRSISDPVKGSCRGPIITVRHSATMFIGEAGDELMIPTEENPYYNSVEKKIFKPFLYIQMELCDKSLKDWIAERNGGTEKDNDLYTRVDRRFCLNVFEQMTRGLKYIHGHNIIHRDIKPANILLVNKPDGSLQVKFADFGLSTLVRDCNKNQDDMNAEAHSLSTDIGTRHYAAPEQRQGKNYDQKADMYSLGLILFELFQPYTTIMELMRLTEGLRHDPIAIDRQFCGRWGDVAECVCNLVDKNPENRPTAEHLLNCCPLLTTWRFLKTENESLRKRVEFLEAENKRLRELLETSCQ